MDILNIIMGIVFIAFALILLWAATDIKDEKARQ